MQGVGQVKKVWIPASLHACPVHAGCTRPLRTTAVTKRGPRRQLWSDRLLKNNLESMEDMIP